MSIVTQLPNVSAQSRAFISGRSKKVHGTVTYIHKQGRGNGGKEVGGKKVWAGIQVAVWACVYKFWVKHLGWVKRGINGE